MCELFYVWERQLIRTNWEKRRLYEVPRFLISRSGDMNVPTTIFTCFLSALTSRSKLNYELSVCVCAYVSMRAWMCVRMYVCMYVYMYVCMYVCMNICMYVCVYVCMYGCMQQCTCVFVYVHMYVCMYICIYVHMYVCTHVCMYVRTYVCMYVRMLLRMYVRMDGGTIYTNERSRSRTQTRELRSTQCGIY
jgi:hypothetical protein